MRLFALCVLFQYIIYTIADLRDDPTAAPTDIPFCEVSEAEVNALYDLYYATDGDNWSWTKISDKPQWDFTGLNPNPCYPVAWQGILCSDAVKAQCTIQELELPNFNLVGSIPESIGNLTYLLALSLVGNTLKNTLPETIGNLTLLQVLYLQQNKLSGSIPNIFNNMKDMLQLDLEVNHFVGPIPESICSMSQLQMLYLFDNKLSGTLLDCITDLSDLSILQIYKNHLTGTIPKDIGKLTKMETFAIQYNKFNGTVPESIGYMTSMTNFYLNDNRLSGLIPNGICNFQDLTIFLMNINKLTGTLPNCFDNFPNLALFYTKHNNFNGTIPPTLGGAISLTHLELDHNNFTGPIPTLSNLDQLVVLQLGGNDLSGTLPTSLCYLPSLVNIDFSYNNIEGSIPDCIGNLTSLGSLYMSNTLLDGRIPDSICSATTLQFLLLNNNYLTGSIPTCIGALSILEELSIGYNYLNGSIPDGLGDIPTLTLLDLMHNQLTGSLPRSICNLTVLRHIIASNNLLTGSIPDCIDNMKTLRFIEIVDNNFNGSLPQTIGELPLFELLLTFNNFIGTIPSSLCKLVHLKELQIGFNKLSGNLPECIGNFSNIRYYIASFNNFNGTIPASYGSMRDILNLQLNGNQLTGSIPSTLIKANFSLIQLNLGNNNLIGSIPFKLEFKHMSRLYLNDNQFTGTIPIINLPVLETFQIDSNEFHGSIPDSICDSTLLEYIILYDNAFSGEIPDCSFNFMINFNVSYNSFTGTIPNHIVYNRTEYFLLDHNYFTGTIPDVFNSLININQLLLDSNSFSGSVPTPQNNLRLIYLQNNLFSGTLPYTAKTLPLLQYLDVSNNDLTGTLPQDLFNELVPLLSFTASSNCITGTIPTSLCSLQSVTYIGLDGLSTAKSCRKSIFPDISWSTSFYLLNDIRGSIPECLFNLATLTTLQLSGNSIQGSFPSDLTVSDSLKSMSLSHNSLTGTIPDQVQLKPWNSLDLSYNRLVGVINPDISLADNSSLTLQVNRLSGVIPNSILNLQYINILTGNLFGCNFRRDSLPKHDNAYEIYECGSNSFDAASIAWGCCAIVAICVVILVWQKYICLSRGLSLWQEYMKELDFTANLRLYSHKQFILTLRNVTIGLTVLILVVFLPIYGVLTAYFKTAEHQYAWTVSAAFLSGSTPAVVLLVFFMLLILVFFAVWYYLSEQRFNSTHHTDTSKDGINWKLYAVSFCVLLINCGIMSVANGGYVYVILNYDTDIVFIAQMCTALFKLFWNEYAVRMMIIVARNLYHPEKDDLMKSVDGERSISVESQRVHYISQEMPFMAFIVLFNSIIAPCIATAAVDSNCFYNVFVAPPEVTSTFQEIVPVCVTSLVGEFCSENSTTVSKVEISYGPPFIYSYQCTSAILTNYASMYVFMYLFVAFLKPLAIYVLIGVFNSVSRESLVFKFFNMVLSALTKSYHDDKQLPEVIFRKERFILRTVSKIAVFVTFGVVFPPLAFVVCIAMIVESHLNLILIGRFLVTHKECSLFAGLKEQLCHECEGCMELVLIPLARLVVPFAAFFYAFFVFDIYGDAVGYMDAIWATVLMCLWPLVVSVMYFVYLRFRKEPVVEPSGRESELTTVNNVVRSSKQSDVDAMDYVKMA